MNECNQDIDLPKKNEKLVDSGREYLPKLEPPNEPQPQGKTADLVVDPKKTEKKFHGIIYRAYCTVTGKSYIGQTISPVVRLREHISNARAGVKTPLYNALRKYGLETFDWSVISHCTTKESLSDSEKRYIKSFNSIAPNGYNISEGGRVVQGQEDQKLLKII